jgi:nucleoside-diphosphate-sugar epimerase
MTNEQELAGRAQLPRLPATDLRGQRVLLTGATGFLGRWVARLLSELGADLHVTVRDRRVMASISEAYGLVATFHQVDLSQPGEAQRVCETLRPAVVFNLAGYGVDPTERDPLLTAQLNHALPQELALAMAAIDTPSWTGRQLVHAGSALQYGPVEGPISEATASAPTTLYGQTKLAGADAIATACGVGLRAAEGRIFTAYGPGEHAPRLLPSLFRARHHTDPILLTAGVQQRDFIYVKDVAHALVGLALSTQSGFRSVNVATGTLSSVKDFVLAAAAALSLPIDRLKFGALPYRAEEMWHGPVSCEALRRETGFSASLRIADGLLDAVEFTGST